MTSVPEQTWENYRTALVDRTLRGLHILAWIGTPLFIWRTATASWRTPNAVILALIIAGLIFYHFYANRASTNVKAGVLVAVFFSLGVPGLFNLGLLSNGLLLLASGCFCAALVFSRRTSIIISSLSLAYLTLVGIGHVSGYLKGPPDAAAFATAVPTWLTAVLVNFFSVLLLVGAISTFRSSIKTLLHEVQEQKELIQFQANHDPLTALPTLQLANDRLDMALNAAHRSQTKVALMFIDLDGFKDANDTYGHEAGDWVLQEVARRLKLGIRATDTVARIGGDEFLIILADLQDPAVAAGAARKLVDAVSAPVHYKDREIRVGCSIGIAIFPDHAADAQGLRRFADTAMYDVKRRGKNGYAFYKAAA